MQKFNQITVFIALIFSTCMTGQAADAPNWQVTRGIDALTQKRSTCLIESAKRSVDDGRTTTPIQIVYNDKAFLIKTRTKIDLTYPNLGLHVDGGAVHNIDRVYKDTDVKFDSDTDKIREQFIKGKYAYIALGFWPTWPKSRTIVTRFSLTGFNARYRDYLSCLNTPLATNKQ